MFSKTILSSRINSGGNDSLGETSVSPCASSKLLSSSFCNSKYSYHTCFCEVPFAMQLGKAYAGENLRQSQNHFVPAVTFHPPAAHSSGRVSTVFGENGGFLTFFKVFLGRIALILARIVSVLVRTVSVPVGLLQSLSGLFQSLQGLLQS